MKPRRSVLVMDDEDYVRDSLAELLAGEEGLRTLVASTTDEARELLLREGVDLVLADLQMPCGGAQALLDERDEQDEHPPLIVITGVGTVPAAVAAMKAGAFDFVQKPVEAEALLHLVERALEHARLVGTLRFLRGSLDRRRMGLVGDSAATRRIRELIDQVAPTEATVLITGESGTGKELVAEALHAASPRAAGNLVRVNCAAVPDSLFESEFFGHRRGAFSGAVENRQGRFAEAEGGTLVLDEISTLRPDMQAKLLRVLEAREYQVVGESGTRVADARVVAISNEDLQERIDQGDFRADLYYRLAVFPIEVAPLRERVEDVVPVARAFLARARELDLDAVQLDEAAGEVLRSYAWPGNVRELRNVIERATILAASDWPDAALYASLLEPAMQAARPPVGVDDDDLHLRTRLQRTERETLRAALERAEGSRKDAAAMLGIDPRNLAYYLRKHDLPVGTERRED